MSRWFRFYSDAMRNPKVARLTDYEFRLWVELLAVAAENEGAIPCADDLKHILKRRLDHLLRGLNGLITHGLMDALGCGYTPHNWNKFQYKSDTSTDRVHKHREKRNVSVTPPDTETDTETEKKNPPTPQAGGGDVPIIPDWMPAKQWGAYLDMRRRKTGKAPTIYTIELLIAKLDRWRMVGHDPGTVLDASTENNWTGIFEPKDERNGKTGKPGNGVTAALDKRIGSDEPAGETGRSAIGRSGGNSPLALAGPAAM